MICFSCPTCKFVLQSPAQDAGNKIECPKCGQRLLIPNPAKPAASNKTVLGSLLPSSSGLTATSSRATGSVPQSTDAGTVDVTCPCCGRVIPLSPHELSLVIQCSRCLAPFNPSSHLPSLSGVSAASQQPPSPLSAAQDESRVLWGIKKDDGLQQAPTGLRVRLCGFWPATAAGLLFLACLGLVSWLFWRGKAAEAPEPELLRYLPNYSQIIISIRPPSIAKSQLFRRLARRSAKIRKLEAEFEEGSGLPLARVKQMMISMVGNDEPVVVCRMDSTIHVADMFANMKEPRFKYSEEKVAGHIIHVKNRADAFCIVREDLVLFGHFDTLQAILLREGSPELSGGLKTAMHCADFSKDCVVVMNSKDLLRKVWSLLRLEAKEPHELMDAIMLADAAVAAEASFG